MKTLMRISCLLVISFSIISELSWSVEAQEAKPSATQSSTPKAVPAGNSAPGGTRPRRPGNQGGNGGNKQGGNRPNGNQGNKKQDVPSNPIPTASNVQKVKRQAPSTVKPGTTKTPGSPPKPTTARPTSRPTTRPAAKPATTRPAPKPVSAAKP